MMVEGRYKGEINLSGLDANKLPKTIGLATTIQFLDEVERQHYHVECFIATRTPPEGQVWFYRGQSFDGLDPAQRYFSALHSGLRNALGRDRTIRAKVLRDHSLDPPRAYSPVEVCTNTRDQRQYGNRIIISYIRELQRGQMYIVTGSSLDPNLHEAQYQSDRLPARVRLIEGSLAQAATSAERMRDELQAQLH